MASDSYQDAVIGQSEYRTSEPSATDAPVLDLENFSPKGAVVFFALMILMFTLMWFSMYYELIDRI